MSGKLEPWGMKDRGTVVLTSGDDTADDAFTLEVGHYYRLSVICPTPDGVLFNFTATAPTSDGAGIPLFTASPIIFRALDGQTSISIRAYIEADNVVNLVELY